MGAEDAREGIRKSVEETIGRGIKSRGIKAIWVHLQSEQKRIYDDIKILVCVIG